MFKLIYFVILLWWGYLGDTCELAGMQLPHLPPSNWSVLPSHLIATFITTRALLFFIFLSWWKEWGKLIHLKQVCHWSATSTGRQTVRLTPIWHKMRRFFFLNWAEAHDTSSHVIDWRNRNIRFRPSFLFLESAHSCGDGLSRQIW